MLWKFFEQGFKVPGRLTAQGPSLFINPLVDRKFLEKEKKRDIDNYNREFEAQFAEKVEAFLSYDIVINSLKLAGDVPYNDKHNYMAGIDASGLAGRDRFAFAIGHKEDKNIFIDKSITWDIKDPDVIMADIEELAKIYHITRVDIDRYAKGWVQHSLEKIGLEVEIRPLMAEIYTNLKSLAIGNRLYLPDNEGLKKSMLNVQGYYGKNNSLSIAHERNNEGHADLLDAITTVVNMLSKEEKIIPQIFVISGNDDDEDDDFDSDQGIFNI